MSEINIFSEDVENPLLNKEATVEKCILALLKNEKKELGELNVIFCSDKYILTINKTYLSHDYYTDIVSFDNSVNNTISGDIYISTDTVKLNSEEYKVSFENELYRVIFHGILHFCGYNDLNEEQIKEMKAKEDFYLSYNNL